MAKDVQLTKEKSEAVAGMLQILLQNVDLLLGATHFEAISYLKTFEENAENRRYAASCLAYDEVKDDRLKLELDTLRAIIALLEVRKVQIEAMPELKRKEAAQEGFQDFINSLI